MRALLLAVAACAACLAQNAVEFPGEGLEEGLFSLRQMDFHLHSGMERPVELEKWIDIAVADGRKVILLVDHLELYRKTAAAYRLWRAHGGFQAQYPVGAEGHKAVFADFDAAARRTDVL